MTETVFLDQITFEELRLEVYNIAGLDSALVQQPTADRGMAVMQLILIIPANGVFTVSYVVGANEVAGRAMAYGQVIEYAKKTVTLH